VDDKEDANEIFDLKKTKLDNLFYLGYGEWATVTDFVDHLHSDWFMDFAEVRAGGGSRGLLRGQLPLCAFQLLPPAALTARAYALATCSAAWHALYHAAACVQPCSCVLLTSLCMRATHVRPHVHARWDRLRTRRACAGSCSGWRTCRRTSRRRRTRSTRWAGCSGSGGVGCSGLRWVGVGYGGGVWGFS